MVDFINFVKQENEKYKHEFQKRSNTVRNNPISSEKKSGRNKIKIYVPNHIRDSFKRFDDSGINYDENMEYFEEIFRTRHLKKNSKRSKGKILFFFRMDI